MIREVSRDKAYWIHHNEISENGQMLVKEIGCFFGSASFFRLCKRNIQKFNFDDETLSANSKVVSWIEKSSPSNSFSAGLMIHPTTFWEFCYPPSYHQRCGINQNLETGKKTFGGITGILYFKIKFN
ncbi:uncharacterized protein LOC111073808 [Drosophila obscura]|uniref:uncharacterized protein LOC111073808 n=1 Tax=Drosophila obscura TaxID=7282 RepID=UPI001BB11C08|nr:uncharacterized protein LOC111073808 [Drosophila obscura]